MRQRLQEPQSPSYRYQAPPQSQQRTQEAPPKVIQTPQWRQRARKEVTLPRKRFIALALLGVFAFPWMPLKATPQLTAPTGTANALYNAEARVYKQDLAAAERIAQKTPVGKTRALPEALTDPSGFATLEQARQNRDQLKRHLGVLKKGLTLPMQEVAWDFSTPYEAPLLNCIYVRELARLSVRDGNLKQLEGNYSGAMTAYLDAYALGVQASHAGALVSGMIGALCQGMACVPAEVAVPHLTAAQAREATARMETIQAQQLSFAEVLAGETRVVEPENVSYLGRSLVKQPVFGRIPAVQLANNYLTARYKVAMQQAVVKAQQPYRKLGGEIHVQKVPFDPATLLGTNDLPSVNQAYLSYCSRETLGRRLLLELALRAWQAEHGGAFPTELGALVKAGYLKKLPTDPFSHSGQESFHYDSQTGKVWSVGPDGVDAHGTGDDATLMKAQ